MSDDVLTPEEAAEILRVHPETIMRRLRKGEIPAAKIGKQWRISRKTIDRMLRGEDPREEEKTE